MRHWKNRRFREPPLNRFQHAPLHRPFFIAGHWHEVARRVFAPQRSPLTFARDATAVDRAIFLGALITAEY
jgi:hypothetical protein